MKIKCEKCSHIQEIILDGLIFDDELVEGIITLLAAELSKSQSEEKEEDNHDPIIFLKKMDLIDFDDMNIILQNPRKGKRQHC